MTRKLLTLAALAVTLSAQEAMHCPCPTTTATPEMVSQMRQWQSFDGQGALEAFYVQPAHHSIFKSNKFWIGVAAVAGSGVLAGYLATRSSAHSLGPAASIQQPGVVDPASAITVNGPTFIGLGGPGLPVVTGGHK